MSKEILNVSDAFSSANVDVLNQSEVKYDDSNYSNMLSQKYYVKLLVNFVSHENDDKLTNPKSKSKVQVQV